MKFSDKSIVALMIFSIKAFHITHASSSNEDAAVPLHITVSSSLEVMHVMSLKLSISSYLVGY